MDSEERSPLLTKGPLQGEMQGLWGGVCVTCLILSNARASAGSSHAAGRLQTTVCCRSLRMCSASRRGIGLRPACNDPIGTRINGRPHLESPKGHKNVSKERLPAIPSIPYDPSANLYLLEKPSHSPLVTATVSRVHFVFLSSTGKKNSVSYNQTPWSQVTF